VAQKSLAGVLTKLALADLAGRLLWSNCRRTIFAA
jgi:hypothetical protein